MAINDISVIIRARDEEAGVVRCLESLAAQQGVGDVEMILVDGGSRDRTPDVAADRGAAVIALAMHEFTFGGALNDGASAARHPLIVALSAHAFAPDAGWLARLADRFNADDRVACACGDRYDHDGNELTRPVLQDAALARRRPDWGYANAAGGFRADLWRRRPFRADLPGCEDKEWAWHWLQHGYSCVVDPALAVEHDHTHDSLRSIYRRARREAEGYAAFLDDPPGPATPAALARAWWSDTRWYGSPARARLSHRRAARLYGAYAGRRQGAASSSSSGVPRA
jgi:glycosyltransferase involved in cell wall biosynthesis